ncbi:MAG TPA: peptidoglycan-binding domain-containing protein, partial [Xanthobacteraceae bacterium]
MQYPGRVVKVGEKDVDLVDHIVAGLTKHGYVSGSAAGSFNAELASLIRMFQAQHVDAVGNPLKVDGEVGSLTWGALFGAEPVVTSLTGIASVALSKA